jgi:hypothetical protein
MQHRNRWLVVVLSVVVMEGAGPAWGQLVTCPDGKGGSIVQNAPCEKTWGPPKAPWQDVIEEAIRRDAIRLQQQQAGEAARQQRLAAEIARIGRTPLPPAYRAAIDAALVQRLKDPDSRRIAWRSTPLGSLVCGTVNARNSFGGYTGEQPFLAYFDADGRLEDLKVYPGDERFLHPPGSDIDGELLQQCGFVH